MITGIKKKNKLTEIWFDEIGSAVTIRTYNTDLKNRLTAYAAKYPAHCRLPDDDECGCGHDHDHEHHHDHDGECGCGHDHHHGHHHADEVFTSWGVETPDKYDKETLSEILRKLSETDDYGDILRAKGMLPTPEGKWMFFDLVPEEYEIRDGEPEITGRICVIGAKLKEDALKELFNV